MRSSLKYTVTAAVTVRLGFAQLLARSHSRSWTSEADTTVKYSVAQGDYCYGEGGGEGEGEPKSVYLSIYLSMESTVAEFRVQSLFESTVALAAHPGQLSIYLSTAVESTFVDISPSTPTFPTLGSVVKVGEYTLTSPHEREVLHTGGTHRRDGGGAWPGVPGWTTAATWEWAAADLSASYGENRLCSYQPISQC